MTRSRETHEQYRIQEGYKPLACLCLQPRVRTRLKWEQIMYYTHPFWFTTMDSEPWTGLIETNHMWNEWHIMHWVNTHTYARETRWNSTEVEARLWRLQKWRSTQLTEQVRDRWTRFTGIWRASNAFLKGNMYTFTLNWPCRDGKGKRGVYATPKLQTQQSHSLTASQPP